jgi:cellulose synthase/poly-beta-1,6-N-acetylglucosamine synthase-like glycosyltransferase
MAFLTWLGWAPLGLVATLSWALWFVRRYLAHRYRPVTNTHREPVSVVVPVFAEDPEVLERCLRTWVAQQPLEVLVVVDETDQVIRDRLQALALPAVTVLPRPHTGKRGFLAAGVRRARGGIVVLTDSDTSWRPGMLDAVQMPFADPQVGAVGTRQFVHEPRRSLCRRIAHWLLNTRNLDYLPALSRAGSLPCVSGRTAAYRRDVITPLLPQLEHERFLGRTCLAGDDGRLTWLVLSAGYRTTHQDLARVDSVFPDTLGVFFRQRLRWGRNSYRCYLTAIARGWLWQQPLLTQITVLQNLLTPLTMTWAAWYAVRWSVRGGVAGGLLVLLWACLGRALRGFSHLREHPEDVLLTPLMVLVTVILALPVKVWALVTMNRHAWLTRTAAVQEPAAAPEAFEHAA